MSSSSHRAVAAALVLSSLALARTGHADKAAADVAFAEAKRLVAEGKIAEACPKFELSQKEDPQLGTLLNLADCHEQLGKLATAWAEFRAATELAQHRGDSREAFARERSEKLASRIPRVVFVARGETDGLHVKLDDQDVTALLGVPIPVDPGKHVIATRSGDGIRGHETITVKREGRKLEVQVPLAPEEDEDRPGASSEEEHRQAGGGMRRTVGLAAAGAGLVAAGVGLYFGKQAFDRWDESRAYCDAQNRCSMQGAALIDDANTAALEANVLVGAGVGVAAVGAILWLTAPSEHPDAPTRATVSARPIVTRSLVGGALTVGF